MVSPTTIVVCGMIAVHFASGCLAVELIENGSFENFVRRPTPRVFGWSIAPGIGIGAAIVIQEYPYVFEKPARTTTPRRLFATT